MTVIGWILIVLAALAFIGFLAVPHALILLIVGILLVVLFGSHYWYGRRGL